MAIAKGKNSVYDNQSAIEGQKGQQLGNLFSNMGQGVSNVASVYGAQDKATPASNNPFGKITSFYDAEEEKKKKLSDYNPTMMA